MYLRVKSGRFGFVERFIYLKIDGALCVRDNDVLSDISKEDVTIICFVMMSLHNSYILILLSFVVTTTL